MKVVTPCTARAQITCQLRRLRVHELVVFPEGVFPPKAEHLCLLLFIVTIVPEAALKKSECTTACALLPATILGPLQKAIAWIPCELLMATCAGHSKGLRLS